MDIPQTVARVEVLANLPPRQQQMATLIGLHAMTYQEAAVVMDLAPNTIHNVITVIYRKLGFDPYCGSPGHELALIFGFIEGYRFARPYVDLQEAAA